jgi:hypothetical protein
MVRPLTARETKARQLVLGDGALDGWAAKFVRYHTTATDCRCPDFQIRGRRGEIAACKHILALRLLDEKAKEE